MIFLDPTIYDPNTVILPYLSHQRDSTVPHYTVCDRILKKYYRYIVRYICRYIYSYFLLRYTNRYIHRYFNR